MTATRHCIYCREELQGRQPREHVIPKGLTAGFGGSNLTLGCVCSDCNAYFGRELERVFVADTVLGPLRYDRGVKRDTRKAPIPDEGRISMRVRGMCVELRATETGQGYDIRLPTQVGFRRRGDPRGPFTYHLLDNIDQALADARTDARSYHIVGQGPDFIDDALRCLASRGVHPRSHSGTHALLPENPDGSTSVEVEYVQMIDRVIRRCMAKIGFNYLAYVTTQRLGRSDWLQHGSFGVVRDFVRCRDAPVTPGFSFRFGLEFRHRGQPQPDGHLAAVMWQRQMSDIIATVSLFSTFAWQVELAHSFSGLVWKLSSGHFWNLGARTVHPLRAVPKGLLPFGRG